MQRNPEGGTHLIELNEVGLRQRCVVLSDGAKAEKSEGVESASLVGVRKLQSPEAPVCRNVFFFSHMTVPLILD